MVYDSIANASIPTAAANPKEFGKKKRVNRTAKIKQSKLDVRREQWLSQAKNKGYKEENKGANRAKAPALDMHVPIEGDQSITKLVINSSVNEENDGLTNHYCDWESPSNSPASHTSSLASHRSVTNFTGSSSSSSSSGGCYSGSMTEEDYNDDNCLDDWEAIADALAADDIKNNHNPNPNQESQIDENSPQVDQPTDSEPVETTKKVNRRAWRPDDTFRPNCLPNLLKQKSFPMNSDRLYVGFAPTTCPICCEDLDLTDSSFVPCPCGYRLCLFCYKRILEDNCRCPGCRKQYEQPEQGNSVSKLARSYSVMIPRH